MIPCEQWGVGTPAYEQGGSDPLSDRRLAPYNVLDAGHCMSIGAYLSMTQNTQLPVPGAQLEFHSLLPVEVQQQHARAQNGP